MIVIIIVLILTSGFFVLFMQALQSVRIPRMQKAAADAGSQGTRHYAKAQKYRRVIEAAGNPGIYFMAVRFLVCTLRTIAAVLGGMSVGQSSPIHAAGCAAALICAFLLPGELIPRLIARAAPEPAAMALFPLFRALTVPLSPLFRLTQAAAERMRLAAHGETGQGTMTEDELRLALEEGEKSGIVASKERTMVEGVFYLGDKPLGAFMTHRSEIQWFDIKTPPEEVRAKALEHREQRCFPVADGTLDSIVGAAYLEDIILDFNSNTPSGLHSIIKNAELVPETMPALQAFESFKRGKAQYLFVMDEYGGFAGMVSVRDLMEEIVGELTASASGEEEVVRQEDGSWNVSGALNIDDAAALLSIPDLAASGDYHTLAGFLLSLAGELPRIGDSFDYHDYCLTVLDMDGNRIDRIKVSNK
ncbi:MAG: hemolysin family protein [Treponema sp.]|nr:hemolysin family protein [Treponema sp.]